MERERQYIAIDLKSFYASEECVARKLDPLTTCLVVADESRSEKTICLAVTPALKHFGLPGRARLFEVIQAVKQINAARLAHAPGKRFSGKSSNLPDLQRDPSLALDFIIAQPRMAQYIQRSTQIYQIYLRHVAPEDIHVYSIDEVFMDATPYLSAAGQSASQFASVMIREIFAETGISAAAGIGTNLYLAKVAMDILAKHAKPDAYGVRIAMLDEMSYRQQLWSHRPLTDFWRIGPGYARKLEQHGMFTMGDVARCSIGKPGSAHSEDLLYKLFGVNAELLIDHAWGWESCTMADIKAFKPSSNSLGTCQVLSEPYTFAQGRLIVREMADLLALDLLDQKLVTDQVSLMIGYDVACLTDPAISAAYRGETVKDHYGRRVPKAVHGSINLPQFTASTRLIMEAFTSLYDHLVDPRLLVRRVNLVASRILPEHATPIPAYEQLDFFTDHQAEEQRRQQNEAALAQEKRRQLAVLDIRRRFCKNAILKGMNLQEGATAMDRNRQIGGHKA